MNWKYILVGIVGTACLFGFLASVWVDMHRETVTIYLDEIIVTPNSTH